MAINFPDSPSVNDTHTVGDKTWTWDGTSWNVVTAASGDHGNLGGLSDDDHTQYLRVDGSRSADSLTISDDLTVDTDTFHVDSTNNRVGIGTTSPNETLDVQGSIGFSTGGGRTAGSLFSDSHGGLITTAAQSSPALVEFAWFNADDTERMRIDTSGNVGIGTTSPGSPLHLFGAGNAVDQIRISSTGGTVSEYGFLGADASTDVMRYGYWTGSGFGNHHFEGNVGIGTASPGAKLDVVGEIKADGFITIGASNATEGGEIRLDGGTSYSSTYARIDRYGASGLRFLDGSAVRMSLDISNGNLDVAGAISSLGSAMLGVRQVLASHKTGYSLTGTTEIDTGLSVTITPKSTSSKILVFWSHAFYISGACNINSRLKRGTTQLQLNYAGDWGAAGNGTVNNYYLDSPNTTSAVTYKTTMQSSNTTGVYVSNSSSSSYLLVVEIL